MPSGTLVLAWPGCQERGEPSEARVRVSPAPRGCP